MPATSNAAPFFTSTVMPLFPNTDCAPYFMMPAATVTPERYDIELAITSVPAPSLTSVPVNCGLLPELKVSVSFAGTVTRMLPALLVNTACFMANAG